VVYASVSADADAAPRNERAVWDRILERSWAVVVVDLIGTYLLSFGIGATMVADVLSFVTGLIALLLSVLLVFADTSATIDDGMPVWWLVPGAIGRSIVTAWRGGMMVRAVLIFSIGFFASYLAGGLFALMGSAHIPNADFWAQLPLDDILTPPLAAFTVLVYRDARLAQAAGNE